MKKYAGILCALFVTILFSSCDNEKEEKNIQQGIKVWETVYEFSEIYHAAGTYDNLAHSHLSFKTNQEDFRGINIAFFNAPDIPITGIYGYSPDEEEKSFKPYYIYLWSDDFKTDVNSRSINGNEEDDSDILHGREIFIKEGTLEIKKNKNDYSIILDFTDMEGNKVSTYYKGKLPEPSEIRFDK